MSNQTAETFSSDLSNTQSRRIEHLVSTALSEIHAFGTSRSDAKKELYEEGFKTSHEVNSRIGITSYESYKKDKSVAMIFTKFCFEEYKIKQLSQIKPEMVVHFIDNAIERDCSKNTCNGYTSGINKFAQALDKLCPTAIPRTETWYAATQSCKEMINNEAPVLDNGTRAYNNPDAIINAISEPNLRICAEMQLHYGLRLADATKLSDIKGNILTVHNSKNGQDIKVTLTDADAQRLQCGVNVKQSTYRTALQNACAETGQEWNGTHGLRHNFAQNRMSELTEGGMSRSSALATVSEEMGHHRPAITEIYLR